jgi:hypothetical protein
MTDYKVFLLNETGRIHRIIDIIAPTDDDAVVEISQVHEPEGFEVWSGDRLVARGGALSEPAQS